ncbi:hypothetical protein T484DRAFT_3018786 [Baffinella frigidus]|nr:hypothetical protein T484DRAFT_3018786 [Cryptophyta sp. CCMP2293]
MGEVPLYPRIVLTQGAHQDRKTPPRLPPYLHAKTPPLSQDHRRVLGRTAPLHGSRNPCQYRGTSFVRTRPPSEDHRAPPTGTGLLQPPPRLGREADAEPGGSVGLGRLLRLPLRVRRRPGPSAREVHVGPGGGRCGGERAPARGFLLARGEHRDVEHPLRRVWRRVPGAPDVAHLDLDAEVARRGEREARGRERAVGDGRGVVLVVKREARERRGLPADEGARGEEREAVVPHLVVGDRERGGLPRHRRHHPVPVVIRALRRREHLPGSLPLLEERALIGGHFVLQHRLAVRAVPPRVVRHLSVLSFSVLEGAYFV